MSKRRRILQRLEKLTDLEEILTALKNMASVELQRLSNLTPVHQHTQASIALALRDFCHFHPALVEQHCQPTPETPRICILVGSERGFCGGMNSHLWSYYREWRQSLNREPYVIVCGSRLANLMHDDSQGAVTLPGCTTLEEVKQTIDQILATLSQWQQYPLSQLSVIHQGEEGVEQRVLLPLPDYAREPVPENNSPLLQMPELDLFLDLMNHFIYHSLVDIFFQSLRVENQLRLMQMQSALNYLDKSSQHLLQKSNQIRQEEITEEIETIILTVHSKAEGELFQQTSIEETPFVR